MTVTSFSNMASASSNILFDDLFTIESIDKEGKKFDRGSSRFLLLDPTHSCGPLSLPLVCPLIEFRHGPGSRL